MLSHRSIPRSGITCQLDSYRRAQYLASASISFLCDFSAGVSLVLVSATLLDFDGSIDLSRFFVEDMVDVVRVDTASFSSSAV
jgi:hypothetical protein